MTSSFMYSHSQSSTIMDKMAKKMRSYYLDQENIDWVENEAVKEDRKPSFWLNKLLTKLRTKKK